METRQILAPPKVTNPMCNGGTSQHMALGQNLVALVNMKIAGKLVFTPLTLIITGFDTHPY